MTNRTHVPNTAAVSAEPGTLCRVCGGTGRKIINLKDGFAAMRCASCSVVYADPMPSGEELGTYYAQWMFNAPAPGQVQLWEQHSRQGVGEVVREIATTRSAPISKALDFGGGLGFFANALTAHAPDVTLFDMSAPSRAYARTSFPAVNVCDEAEQALARGPFDLILLNQVIEHVPDPVGFMRPLVAALAPGGVLIVTTPNNAMLDPLFRLELLKRYAENSTAGRVPAAARMMRDSWLCLDPPRHIYAFNAQSLRQAAEKAGAVTLRTFSRTYADDPFGYPMYAKATGVARRINGAIRSSGAAIVGMLDRDGSRGNTLIGYFARP